MIRNVHDVRTIVLWIITAVLNVYHFRNMTASFYRNILSTTASVPPKWFTYSPNDVRTICCMDNNSSIKRLSFHGYDGVFLMEYLVNHSIRPSKVIKMGSEIMYMEVAKGQHIRVLDSLNFLPIKLSDCLKFSA